MRLELNRRKFLKLTGVLALTASASALTACGGGGGNSPSNSNSTSPNPSTPSDTSDPDTPPETSSPEETNGILWIYRKTSETSATLLGYSTSGKIPSGDVVLPSVINGLEITKIHTSAFKSQTWTGVEIPATVQVIRESAFLGCSSLQRITLHAYDVRHDDECRGIPCEIAPFVIVNHWGTIILAEPLELPDDGRRYIDEDTDWDYSPLDADHAPCTTVQDFQTCYCV